MASSGVYEAILTAVRAAVSPIPVLRWEEVDEDVEQDDLPWCAILDAFGQEEATSIGTPTARCMAERGALSVHIFVPAEGPLTVARQLGDSIRNALSFRQLPVAGLGWLELGTTQPPLPDAINDGRWSAMIVDLDYQLHFVRA